MSARAAEAYRQDFTGIADVLATDMTTSIDQLTTDVLDKDHLHRTFARLNETCSLAAVCPVLFDKGRSVLLWCIEDLLDSNPMATVLRQAITKRQLSAFDTDAVATLIAGRRPGRYARQCIAWNWRLCWQAVGPPESQG